MKTTALVIIAAALGAGVACGEGGPASPAADTAMRQQGDGSGPRSPGGFDAMWLSQMIPHHETAVEMGEVCTEQGVRAELDAFCDGVVATQSAEIALMRTWLREWYGIDEVADAMMGGGMGGGAETLSGLTGADLERAFLLEMIPHHEMAVMMSEQCLVRASHAELKELCDRIIEAQTAEIAQMRTWLREWFGLDAGATGGGMMDGGTGGGGPSPGPMGGGGRR